MKTKVFFVLCMAVAAVTFGQNHVGTSKNEISKSQEVKVITPKFYWNKEASQQLQGNHSLLINSYLSENLEYPEKALKYSIQGTEVVRFTVTNKGEVTNIKIVNSVSPEIDQEAIRVLEATSGKWIPGFRNGVPVEMDKEIAMLFQIGKNSVVTNREMREQATVWFKKGSKSLVTQNNPAKAVKYFDKALQCLPYESNILYLRGMARLLLDDKDGAKEDWDRVKSLELIKIEDVKYTQNFTEQIQDQHIN